MCFDFRICDILVLLWFGHYKSGWFLKGLEFWVSQKYILTEDPSLNPWNSLCWIKLGYSSHWKLKDPSQNPSTNIAHWWISLASQKQGHILAWPWSILFLGNYISCIGCFVVVSGCIPRLHFVSWIPSHKASLSPMMLLVTFNFQRLYPNFIAAVLNWMISLFYPLFGISI